MIISVIKILNRLIRTDLKKDTCVCGPGIRYGLFKETKCMKHFWNSTFFKKCRMVFTSHLGPRSLRGNRILCWSGVKCEPFWDSNVLSKDKRESQNSVEFRGNPEGTSLLKPQNAPNSRKIRDFMLINGPEKQFPSRSFRNPS